MSGQPEIAVVMGGGSAPNPYPELTLYQIRQLHALQTRPYDWAIVSLTREVLRWRGEPNPDLI
jgi:hypothetical protein